MPHPPSGGGGGDGASDGCSEGARECGAGQVLGEPAGRDSKHHLRRTIPSPLWLTTVWSRHSFYTLKELSLSKIRVWVSKKADALLGFLDPASLK